ncbi:sigma factor-like helix-turn-helix DNA-binding protein [uncultured Clostridium sp.]|nr:sigma factor-like helix-turn-helix DNA-binding protein [uncultured Clostridium sp.]
MKSAFSGRYPIYGKSDVEIGELLNCSRQYVNQTKNRALKNLRKFLGD